MSLLLHLLLLLYHCVCYYVRVCALGTDTKNKNNKKKQQLLPPLFPHHQSSETKNHALRGGKGRPPPAPSTKQGQKNEANLFFSPQRSLLYASMTPQKKTKTIFACRVLPATYSPPASPSPRGTYASDYSSVTTSISTQCLFFELLGFLRNIAAERIVGGGGSCHTNLTT